MSLVTVKDIRSRLAITLDMSFGFGPFATVIPVAKSTLTQDFPVEVRMLFE